MMYFLGVVAFIIGILAAVAIHELGHMIPAKKFGAFVPAYMIGFGPKLWSKKIGDTEYGIRAILAGGYVNISGMYAPAKDHVVVGKLDGKKIRAAEYRQLDEETQARVKLTAAEDARQASAEEIPPGYEHRAFYLLTVPQKLAVMFGGPVTNLILSVLLIAIAMGGIGYRMPSTTLEAVPQCLNQQTTCAASEEGPAYQAGLKAGDKIVSWNHTQINSWEEVRLAVQTSGDKSVPVVVERDGKQLEFQIKPHKTDTGSVVAGIVSKQERQHGGPVEIAKTSWHMFTGTAYAIVYLPVSLYKLTVNLFNSTPRDPEGAVSVVGVGMLAGQIASAHGHGIGWLDRIASFFALMAALNMALFVFNMVPLLPLDGGHIVGALWQGIRSTWARWRGKPDPGPTDVARATPLTITVWILLMLIMVILVAADIIKPVTF